MRALVTGCGRRLGFYLSQALSAQGWDVVGHYRTEHDGLQQLRTQGIALIQADFNETQGVLTFIEDVKKYNDISLIIHNASAFTPEHDNLQEKAQQFATFFQVHMMAPYLMNHALAPVLESQENALIIHITDVAIHAPWPQYKNYIATKAGSDSLAKSFAKSFAPQIRVNTIEPGPILFLDEHDAQTRQAILSRTPLAREGGLEPIWQAVQFLWDNTYITGAAIKVDGGRALTEL